MAEEIQNNKNVGEKITTTIEVDKELFLKFKSLCVLKQLKMSGVIEEAIKNWVEKESKGIDL
jgi:predicted transcriptional regulator